MVSIEQAQQEFDPTVTYLNTATSGLPPRASWDALQEALSSWRAGRSNAVGYDDPIGRARAAYGELVLLDTTQAVAWLPIDASQYAFTVAGGYKWMLAPRGTAFFTVQPEYLGELTPILANWYAGTDPWDSIYGTPLRLAQTRAGSTCPPRGTRGSARRRRSSCSGTSGSTSSIGTMSGRLPGSGRN